MVQSRNWNSSPQHIRSFIRLTHLQCESLLSRSPICCLPFDVCLSRIGSRKLHEIRAKFCCPCRKSGLPSKKVMSDCASELVTYPKSSPNPQNTPKWESRKRCWAISIRPTRQPIPSSPHHAQTRDPVAEGCVSACIKQPGHRANTAAYDILLQLYVMLWRPVHSDLSTSSFFNWITFHLAIRCRTFQKINL